MTTITSIYIPKIDMKFNAEFIAEIFDRNGIAEISRIYIEPFTNIMKNKEGNKFNRAYIEIKSWYDTENAYNFIECIKNPVKEARIIYGHNSWWKAEINNYQEKLYTNRRVLTVFKNNIDEDELSTTAVADEYTQYKKNLSKKIHYIDYNIHNEYDRQLKAKIYGYKNAVEMNAAEEFDGYLHENPKKYYKQYI
jgi:hypothetical protein